MIDITISTEFLRTLIADNSAWLRAQGLKDVELDGPWLRARYVYEIGPGTVVLPIGVIFQNRRPPCRTRGCPYDGDCERGCIIANFHVDAGPLSDVASKEAAKSAVEMLPIPAANNGGSVFIPVSEYSDRFSVILVAEYLKVLIWPKGELHGEKETRV